MTDDESDVNGWVQVNVRGYRPSGRGRSEIIGVAIWTRRDYDEVCLESADGLWRGKSEDGSFDLLHDRYMLTLR